MRRSPAAVLAIAAVLVALSLVPSVRAQGTPTLNPITDFRVSAVDTDGNGKYDALVGMFNVTVTVAGNFRFQATLTAGYGSYIAINNTDVNLALGTHAMAVSIPGPMVYQSQIDGPYDFQLNIEAVTDQGYMIPYGYLPIDVFTPGYTHLQFEAPWAYLGASITDTGVDTDGNGLYNSLVVHVPVTVNRTTYVQVQGYLGSPYYGGVSSLPTEPLYLTAGSHTLDLSWDGFMLRQYGNLPPGTQQINVALVLPRLLAGSYPSPIARASYTTTHSYSLDQFDRSSASFSSPSATWTAQDTNGNGLADLLVFHLPLSVRVAGDYIAMVGVSGGYGTAAQPQGGKIVHLLPGNTTVDVAVSGIAMNRLNVVGAASVYAQVVRLGSLYYDTDRINFSITVQSSSFESRSLSTLTLNLVPTNTSCGFAYVWDPTNRYLAFNSIYGYGTSIQFGLYDGTFYAVALGCGYTASAAVQKVTVSGATTVTMSLNATSPLSLNTDVSVPSWNSTTLRESGSLGSGSGLYRLIADFYGNADGSADATELSNMGLYLATGYFYVGALGLAREDNRSLSIISRASFSLTGAGDIASTTPLSVAEDITAITRNPPIPGDHHRLVVQLPYSPVGTTSTVTVSLGASAGGNLTMVSRMAVYDGDGFTWPANATATKTGPATWRITVGQAPPNEPPYVSLEIVVDGYGTPTPASPNLLDYVTNPLALTLIVVAVAGVAIFLATRRKKKGPAPPPT